MNVEKAQRLKKLPPYLFAEIDKKKREAIAEGRDIIDFGVGDPDNPTPKFITEAMKKAAEDPENHRYSLGKGLPELRRSIAAWHKKKYNVQLDPDSEILPLIGTKEGIGHLPLAILNNDEIAIIPDPCYPPYISGTIFAGGEPFLVPLKEENNFLPDLNSIEKEILKKSKLLYLNFPNNPTSATASKSFYEDVVNFAKENNIIVCQDGAYLELFYEERPTSFLEVNGTTEIGIEFHSLSKTFNMTGWRIGWAAGNSSVLSALLNLKTNLDSGIFQAIQIAAISALSNSDSFIKKNINIYKTRRDLFINTMREIGFDVFQPKATFYAWVKVPPKYSSVEFCKHVLENADVIFTPGIGFGKSGENYFRAALTVKKERIEEAIERIRKLKL